MNRNKFSGGIFVFLGACNFGVLSVGKIVACFHCNYPVNAIPVIKILMEAIVFRKKPSG